MVPVFNQVIYQCFVFGLPLTLHFCNLCSIVLFAPSSYLIGKWILFQFGKNLITLHQNNLMHHHQLVSSTCKNSRFQIKCCMHYRTCMNILLTTNQCLIWISNCLDKKENEYFICLYVIFMVVLHQYRTISLIVSGDALEAASFPYLYFSKFWFGCILRQVYPVVHISVKFALPIILHFLGVQKCLILYT